MTGNGEWGPGLDSSAQLRLKWGYNHETADVTIWEVAGPGDGFPTHRDHLLQLWGREPRPEAGDTLGAATQHGESVLVAAYYGAPVPPALVDVLRDRFPNALIEL